MRDKGSLPIRQMVIRKVLSHVIECTDAKDSFEGIRDWWPPQAVAEWGEKEVRQAIKDLVSKGWLTKRTIYGVNKARLNEMKAFLSELEDKTEGKDA